MDTFPSRKQVIADHNKDISMRYQESLIDEIKSVDVDKIDFLNSDFKPRLKITEKQKVFFWIRVFLKDEDSASNPDDTVTIKYVGSGESLETKFICYGKKGLDRDNKDEITNYNTEDDKKVLCLMVDSDRVNYNNDDIPYIRTLFKTGRFYEYQLSKRDDLIFMRPDGSIYNYYDVDF